MLLTYLRPCWKLGKRIGTVHMHYADSPANAILAKTSAEIGVDVVFIELCP
jgi:hypothetical protein